jgi:excisionase family DNA binding protein
MMGDRLIIPTVSSRTALLTVAAVASELGVTPRWVHDWIAAGELRAIRRIGRGFRIRREWLDAFLAEREIRGAPRRLHPYGRRLHPCGRRRTANAAPRPGALPSGR